MAVLSCGLNMRIRLWIASVFPQCRYYFHKNIGVIADDFQANREYLSTQRRRNLPVGESRQGHQENRQRDSQSSWETGCLWMDRESSYSECDYRKDGKCGLCSQGPDFLKWLSVVIRGPYRVFEKSESRGDFLEREIAP